MRKEEKYSAIGLIALIILLAVFAYFIYNKPMPLFEPAQEIKNFTFHFYQEWNQFSLPLEINFYYLNTTNFVAEIAKQGGNCSLPIYELNGWNNATQHFQRLIYSLEYGKVYWMYCSKNSDFTIQGSLLAPSNQEMVRSTENWWNFVATRVGMEGTISNFISGCNTIQGVSSWNSSAQRWITYSNFENILIEPGRAYSIYCSDYGDWDAGASLEFSAPTPENEEVFIFQDKNPEINAIISGMKLNQLNFNWENTDFSIYDPSLILMYNFDNNSDIGEYYNEKIIVDFASKNGGFESINPAGTTDVFNDWTENIAGASTISEDNSNVHSGEYSAKLTIDAAENNATLTQPLLESGKRYKLSFWAKVDNSANNPSLSIKSPKLTLYAPLTTSWKEYTFDFISNSNLLIITQGPNTAGKSIYIDDVKLKEINERIADVASYNSSNHGIVYGAVFNQLGRYSGAYQFDGVDDRIRAKITPAIQQGRNYTVSLWIKPYSNAYGQLIDDYNNQEHRIERTTTGQIFMKNYNVSGPVYSPQASTTNIAPINEWTHIVGIQDENSIRIYLNGKLDAKADTTGYIHRVFDDLNIGSIGSTNPGGYFFNGLIDEVRIWNRSLSDNEINFLYKSNLKKSHFNLWNFYFTPASLTEKTYIYNLSVKEISANSGKNWINSKMQSFSVILPNASVSFNPPTPNKTGSGPYGFEQTYEPVIEINASINVNQSSLKELNFTWGGINYSIYDSSLLLMYNFDKMPVLGEGRVNSYQIINSSLRNGNFNMLVPGANLNFDSWTYSHPTGSLGKMIIDGGENCTEGNSNDFCAKLSIDSVASDDYLYNLNTLTPGKRYAFSISMKVDSIPNPNKPPQVTIYTRSVNYGLHIVSPSTTWQTYTGEFIADSTRVSLDPINAVSANRTYWFDNFVLSEVNETIADSSRYNNYATCCEGIYSSCPSWTSNGKYGGAYQFDGDDYLRIKLKSIPQNFTISAWIKRADFSSREQNIAEFSGTRFNVYANKLGFYVNNTRVYGANYINKNGWYFVVYTQNSSTGSIYSNGRLDATITNVTFNSTLLFSFGSYFVIGDITSNDPGYNFNGTIDEVRAYSRVLNQDEIKNLYYSNLKNYDNSNWGFYSKIKLSVYDLYSYLVFAKNSFEKSNQEPLRVLSFAYNNYQSVNISYPSPENGAVINNGELEINATANLEAIKYFALNWNGINRTIYDTSLLRMYNFDNNADLDEEEFVSIKDNSLYGKDLNVIYNAPSVAGKFGQGREFNGIDSYISFENPLLNAKQATICSWAYKKGFIQYAGIIQDYVSYDGQRSFILGYEKPENKIHFFISNCNGTLTTSIADSSNSFKSNQWHFVCGVFDGDNQSIAVYVDGNYTNSTLITPIKNLCGNITSSETRSIGRYAKTSSFNGTIDEIRIWNRSFTKDELDFMYHSNLRKYDYNKWEFIFKPVNLQEGEYSYNLFYDYIFEDISSGQNTLISTPLNLFNLTNPIVPYCGDRGCDNGESCSSCPVDCGSCSGGGGSSSSGSSSKKIACAPRWECLWADCVNGVQAQICKDNNYCESRIGKPAEKTRNCNEQNYNGENNKPAIINEQKTLNIKYYAKYVFVFILVIFALIIIFITLKKYKEGRTVKERISAREDLINKARILAGKWKKAGYNDLIIRQMFAEKGWRKEDIDLALKDFSHEI